MTKKLKCWQEKRGTYYYTPTIAGKTKWINLGRAKDVALLRYYELTEGGYARVTVNDLLDNYIKSEEFSTKYLSPSTIDTYENGMKNVRAYLGHMDATEVDGYILTQFIGKAPGSSGNSWCSPLSNAYKRGQTDGLVRGSPFGKRDIRYMPQPIRVRVVDYEEIMKVRDVIGMQGRLYIDITLLTALRISDVLSLTGDNVRDEGLVVEVQKRRRANQVLQFSWTPELRALCDFLPFDHISPTAMSKRFGRACKKVGVKNLTCHDIRRYVLQECKRLGLNAQQIAGHSSYKQTANYVLGVADTVQPMPARTSVDRPALRVVPQH